MDDLAKRLKTERLQRGWTLREVSERSRINPTILKKLEECRFREIGAPFIVEGLLKSYSDALGIDTGPAGGEGSQQDRAPDRAKHARPGRRTRNAVAALAVCLFLGLLFAGLFWRVPLIQDGKSKNPPPQPESTAANESTTAGAAQNESAPTPAVTAEPEKTAAPKLPSGQGMGKSDVPPAPSREENVAPPPPAPASEPEPATPPSAPQPEQNIAAAPSESTRAPEPAAPPPAPVPEQNLAALPPAASHEPDISASSAPGKVEPPALPGLTQPDFHHLEIQADEKTWIQVKVDNSKPESELLEPGEVRRWKAREKVALTLGNGGGVRMKWDGEPVELSARHGRVVRLTLPPK